MEKLLQLIWPLLAGFAVCIFVGPFVIRMMKRLKFGQQVRDDGPQSHLSKQNTLTIGGLIIFIGLAVCALLFGLSDLSLVACLVAAAYGIVGFLDDFIKIYKKRSLGLRAYQKIVGQFGIAIIAAVYAYQSPYIGSSIYVPFVGYWDLGVFYIPVAVFVVIAIVNAVNLTDGLDGLASGVMAVIMAAFAIIVSFLSVQMAEKGDAIGAEAMRKLAIFCAAVVGCTLGFLRYNVYPARIFMGDTGSFILGGAFAAVALFSRMELLVPVAGGVLVASCVSVILQVGSYKLRKKRIFKMAPLHHHFELLGNHETKVTALYILVTVILCLIAMLFVG